MSLQFDLHEIVGGHGHQTNFGTLLIELIFKADDHNKGLLRMGFPNAVSTVEEYQRYSIIKNLKYD